MNLRCPLGTPSTSVGTHTRDCTKPLFGFVVSCAKLVQSGGNVEDWARWHVLQYGRGMVWYSAIVVALACHPAGVKGPWSPGCRGRGPSWARQPIVLTLHPDQP